MRIRTCFGTAFLAITALMFCHANGINAIAQTPQQSNAEKMKCSMNERGDEAMGFSHLKATHHFRLLQDGGAIEIEANNPQDTKTRDEIRMHLSHVARMFADGNFNAPVFIHDQTPPGVSVMQRLKSEINYEFAKTERGGRVRITTNNPEALAAIQDFLRFQIREHETGDSLDVK